MREPGNGAARARNWCALRVDAVVSPDAEGSAPVVVRIGYCPPSTAARSTPCATQFLTGRTPYQVPLSIAARASCGGAAAVAAAGLTASRGTSKGC